MKFKMTAYTCIISDGPISENDPYILVYISAKFHALITFCTWSTVLVDSVPSWVIRSTLRCTASIIPPWSMLMYTAMVDNKVYRQYRYGSLSKIVLQLACERPFFHVLQSLLKFTQIKYTV